MNYEIKPYDISEFNGYAHISVSVKGFWSNDVITIYVHRSSWSCDEPYEFKISYSSGGRDTNTVKDDVEAVRYMAEALIAASDYVEELKTKTDEFEAAYQAYRAELKAAQERREAERQARIDADTVIGKAKASLVIATLRSMAAEKQYFEQNMYIRRRGSDEVVNISATMNDRAITFRVDSRRRPVKEMLQTIADFAEVVDK